MCRMLGIAKEDILVADVEELENLDASEIHTPRLDEMEVPMPICSGGQLQIACRRWNSRVWLEEIRLPEDPSQVCRGRGAGIFGHVRNLCSEKMKGGSHAKEWGTIRIPFRRWISQDGRKRLGIPKIHFNARSSFTRKVRNDVLQGESDGSQLSDNKRVTQKPEMISGIFLGITFIVIRINLVFNTICQKKGHSFKAVDRFFPVRTILSERPQNHYMWSRERD